MGYVMPYRVSMPCHIYVIKFFFREKTVSCPCIVISVLNDIFHWQAHRVIISKSSIRFDDDITGLVIAEKSEVWSLSVVLHYNTVLVANQ